MHNPIVQHDDMDHMSIEVTIDAPPSTVFAAWTDAARLAQWWGPSGFTNPVCTVDVRPQGAIRIEMKSPDGSVYPMTGAFHEIVPNEKLVFTSEPLDRTGIPMFSVLNIVTFIPDANRTRLTVKAHVSDITPMALPYLDGMDQGWAESLERLEKVTAPSAV